MTFSKTLPSGKDILPPFLFRAASSSYSRGINTADLIDPLAGTGSTYHSDIDSIPELHWKLYDHINYEYKTPSEFSSWPVSLLYVLVHANRKAHFFTEANVLIYVLDTSKLADVGRVRNAVRMLRDLRVKSKSDVLEQYAQGEFLIHGKMENESGMLWKCVEFDELMEKGLWECFYHFRKDLGWEDKLKPLFPMAMRLRGGWFKEDAGLPEGAVGKLRRLAGVFGREWEGVIMVGLICLRKRALHPDGLKLIRKAVEGMKLPELDWDGNVKLRVMHVSEVVRKCPESRLMLQVLRMLHDAETVHVTESTESEGN